MPHPYDLTPYKLTLPVDRQGNMAGKAFEISPPVPVEPWFQIRDDGFLFTCPDHGALTVTAKYPRTELRDMREFTHLQASQDKVKLRVLQCPLECKIVVHQIHDAKEPWIKLVWHQKRYGGLFYALIKATDGAKDTRLDLLSEVTNKQSIVSFWEYDPNGMLVVKGNRVLKRLPVNRTGRGGKAYAKRGNYFQSNSAQGITSAVLHC